MSQNPYRVAETPKLVAEERRPRHSYYVASMLVVAFWIVAFAAIAWFGKLSIQDGKISFEFAPVVSQNTPLGDPIITTHFVWLTPAFTALLVGGAVVFSLAIVNGIVTLARR